MPPVYWTPHCTHNIPHTHDIPHTHHGKPPVYAWYPPVHWTPPVYSWYPSTLIMVSPQCYPLVYWTALVYSQYPPFYSWYPPMYWTSPSVLHLHYAGCTRQYIMNQLGYFKSGCSFGKLKDSSITYFPICVVLYLEIAKSIDRMHKSTFLFWNEPGNIIN